MKIIYSKYFPFKPYKAITLLKWIVVREDVKEYFTAEDYNHECIHYAQEKELLYIGFYILYIIEFLITLLYCFNWHNAYRRISFEREAYKNQSNLNYLQHRKRFAWKKLIIKR